MQWQGKTAKDWLDHVENWNVYYAWVPKQMHDGVWIWFELYESRRLQVMQGLGKWYNRRIGEKYNDPFLPKARPRPPTFRKSAIKPPKPPPVRYIKEGFGEVPPPKHDGKKGA